MSVDAPESTNDDDASRAGADSRPSGDQRATPEAERTAVGSAVTAPILPGELEDLRRQRQTLEIARLIQQRFLPVTDPHFEGLQLIGHAVPCDAIGGDYYDYRQLRDGRILVAIGDVSGHGVPAALIMATARAHVRALVERGKVNLSAVLTRMNALLLEDTEEDRFMTLFLATYEQRTGCLRYANAGHVPPFHVDATTGEVRDLAIHGLPLGITPLVHFPMDEIHLGLGDCVVAVTDGLHEARNSEGEPFGRARLAALVREHARRHPRELIDRTIAAVRAYAGEPEFADDCSLVSLKVTGHAAGAGPETSGAFAIVDGRR